MYVSAVVYVLIMVYVCFTSWLLCRGFYPILRLSASLQRLPVTYSPCKRAERALFIFFTQGF